MKHTIATAFAAALLASASSAGAGTLVHSYDFNSSVGGYVLDQTGSADGLLEGVATYAEATSGAVPEPTT
jgi:hypothetical protein